MGGAGRLENERLSKRDCIRGLAPRHQPQTAERNRSTIPAALLKFAGRNQLLLAPILIMEDS